MAGGDVGGAHRELERRHDDDHRAARPDQVAHAAQSPDVVLNVLQDVVRDDGTVVTAVGVRQQHLAHLDARLLGGEPFLQRDESLRVGLRGGEAG